MRARGRSSRRRSLRVGIDTGGTFTDFHVVSARGSFIFKTPSTPADPAAAVLAGLDRVLAWAVASDPAGRAPGVGLDVSLVHGTTVGTNALLMRRLARTAFVTTAGFEDLVEIGRQNRDSLYDLDADRPAPFVPRSLRFGLAERVFLETEDRKGRAPVTGRRRTFRTETAARRTRRRTPARRDLDRLRERLRALRVEAVAVGFLHSYLDPANETIVGRALGRLAVPVTLSHRISGEYREYERFSTAIANASLRPGVGRYLARLAGEASPARLFVLQSDGTTATAGGASIEPARTVLSGPAGGALAALELAGRLGDDRVLSFDMGGTSTDAVLIDGQLPRLALGTVAGVPIRSPMIDVKTVGAGGGSIARRDAAGALRVGPQSAGADPGPACYGRGEVPTVTDAHLLLGRLGANDLLGGAFPVDPERSRRALSRLARALRMDLYRTSEGVLEVVEATMEHALRAISLERGKDPRRCALYAFGGAGGLHACALAERLGITRIVIPAGPGVFSATGLSAARPGVEVAASLFTAPSDRAALRRGFRSLEARARARLREQGIESPKVRLRLLADLRYVGQSHEITVPFGPAMEGTFQREHRDRYGHVREGSAIEVVTIRLRAEAPAEPGPRLRGDAGDLAALENSLATIPSRPPASPAPAPDGFPGSLRTTAPREAGARSVREPIAPPRRGTHARATVLRPLAGSRAASGAGLSQVRFDGRWVRCRVLSRGEVLRGTLARGPARITEYSATTFVAPGWVARPGPAGAIVLSPGGS